MSHTFYNNLWADAQKDYRQIIREEKKAGKVTGDRAKILDFLTEMCYKYVAIYDKMDRVHDQLVHPQKLPLVRRILDMLIARIIEIRETMVKAELSEYFYPDLYLHWLHLLPPDLDIKIPKYYKHGRGKEWLEHQTWLEGESIRKEMEEQEAALDAEEEVEEKEDNQPIVITLKTDFDDDIDLTIDEAIRAVQTMERARQGRARYAWAKYFVDEEEAQRKKKKMQKQLEAERGDPDRAATIIQRAIRRFLAKRKVDKMRNEELQFIGLSWGPYVPNSPLKEALDKIKEHKKFLDKVLERRRRMQRRYHENFIEAQETIEKRLRLLEAPEMEERMKWQIRTWAVDKKEKEGKVPALPKDEHGGSKFIFCPNQLPEDVLKKAMDAAQGKSSKKSKKDKAKAAREKALRLKKLKEMKKKKAKQKKKEGSKTNVELEPPKFYEDMLETNKEYNKVWRRRDETHNPEQRHEDDMITIEKRELIGKEVRAAVDKMMRAELKLLKSKLDKKKKGKGKKKGKKKGRRSKRGKGRKGKKGKKRKKKGKKGKKDMTKNRTLQSLFEELVKNGIIRRYKKVNLDDLLGEPSIINGTIRKHYEGGYTKPSPWEDLNLRMPGDANPLPTFGDIKRAVKDICILPVGSATVHALSPYTKSVLFAGPPGSGKHTLLNAVCTEMGATLFDISAKVMRGKYKEKGKKKGLKLLMHLLEKVGTLCGPAVILIDDCEKMFQKRLPEEWKKLEPKRLKKSIKRFLKKRIKPENPIILIGITNQPWKAKGKAFKKLYQKVIYFPKPEYGSRLNWWREVLAAHYEHFEPNLNFSLLAKLSDSWTLGSIQKAVKALVNKFSQQEKKLDEVKQESEANSETKTSANQVLPAATTPATAPQNLVPTPLVSLSQAPQQQVPTDENEATAGPTTGKRLIRMDDILSHLSQQDPMFVEQEKAWSKWFNKTPLQRARLKSQVNLTGKKKKGDKGKNKGRSRPGGRGQSSRSKSRRR